VTTVRKFSMRVFRVAEAARAAATEGSDFRGLT
jgi:hypothetical protein